MATQTLTKEQWAELEKRLSSPFGRAILMIDGYKITLVTELSRMKLYIAIYINDYIRVEWANKDCEERRRFLMPKKMYLYKPKERDWYKKQPKRVLKKYNIDPDACITFGLNWWNSFKPMKRHLEANNDSIVLVEE